VSGYEDKTYRPDSSVNRAEFVTLVCRMSGLEAAPIGECFDDVAHDTWYAGYVYAALDAGLISEDAVFRPTDSITREEMCKILTLAIKAKGADENGKTFDVASYSDASLISRWALEYVSFISSFGYMTGRPDGSFDPLGKATRAEVAVVLLRVINSNTI